MAVCMQAGIVSIAQAQMIDDVELRRDGNHAVVQIHFVAPVQLQRVVAMRSGDLVQVYYNITSSPATLNLVRTERRVDDVQGLPKIIITDDDDGRNAANRQLLLRFSEPTRQRVRAGRDSQTLEIVLEGRGAAVSAFTPGVAPTPTPALAVAPALAIATLPLATDTRGRYAINLQRSPASEQALAALIPAEFQDKVVFTAQRVVGGKTVHEVNLGYFQTLPAAENARAKLQRRFPGAAIFALQPEVAAPAPATAAASAPVPRAPAQAAVVPAEPAPPPAPPTSLPAQAARVTAQASALPAVPVLVPSVPLPAPSLPAPVAMTPAPEVVADVAAPSPAMSAQYNAKGAALLAGAQAAYDRNDFPAAIETLNELLNLPTNKSSRRAQEMIGRARLKVEDTARARSEFELFLQLYPTGPDSREIQQLLATLPKPATTARVRPPMEPTTTTSGSVSLFYFGGQSQVRSQDFQVSPISGLPVLQNENTLSGTDLKQMQTSVDLNWRYRDADKDMRFVFRDTASADLMTEGRNRNRLSAMYFDQRSFVNGTNFRVGRQSPTGGGVLYRFDGIQGGYTFAPKWRVNAVYGKPSDDLLDTQRSFYGASIEAEALTKELSGNLYFNQGMIDGEIDRQAIGTELRYFSGGVSIFGQLDYDQVLQGLNIASLQGNWMFADTTVANFMYDRRSTPFRSLGNILFFQDPSQPTIARKISDLLLTNSIDTLRAQVNGITAMQTQAMAGLTTPIKTNWQVGSNVTYTNVGEIAPVPIILPTGQPSTGDLWSLGFQLIGSNLYSTRDTHVFSTTFLSGPTYNGTMLSYNNLTSLNEKWQLEPSLRYYTQSDNTDTRTVRWTPGLRLTYRVRKQVSLETEVTYEIAEVNGPLRTESSTRLFYYFGARYDF